MRRARAVVMVLVAALLWATGLVEHLNAPPILGLALLAGLPHGALDHALATRQQGWSGRRGQFEFHVAYLAAAAAVVGAWIVARPAAVLVFLAFAVWHFGESDLLHRGATSPRALLSRGAVLVGAPVLAWPQQTAQLWQAVVGTEAYPPEALLHYGPTLALALTAAHVGVMALEPGDPTDGMLDALAVGALVTVGGPVFGLALYVVAWHTPDHFASIWRTRTFGCWTHLLRDAAPRTLASGLGIVLLCWLLPDSHWVSAVVCAIAALTVPHTLLVHFVLSDDKPPGLSAPGSPLPLPASTAHPKPLSNVASR